MYNLTFDNMLALINAIEEVIRTIGAVIICIVIIRKIAEIIKVIILSRVTPSDKKAKIAQEQLKNEFANEKKEKETERLELLINLIKGIMKR